jgi:hypothetical protein
MPIRQNQNSANMTRERAETIALMATRFIFADERATAALMAQTGTTADDLRAHLGEAETLAGILDFLLGDERLLVAFAEAEDLDPSQPARARHALAE